MRLLSLTKAVIIGALLVLMAGCSAVRLGYSNGPTLAWWWLDGYVDFSREQSSRAKQAIDRWFEWHRSTQLTGYANLLATAQTEVLEPTTAAKACRWQRLGRDALEPALERALQEAADLVPGLGEAQWQHLEVRFAKSNAELRKDFLQPDADERTKASVKRVLERAEMLYGDFDTAQRKAVAAGVVASPFDPQAWVTERERRQRETVQTLRRLGAQRADRDTILAALRVLADRAERSPDPTYRAYQLRLADYNCAFAAQVHNATTPAQRQAARERLKGWEDDLRSLAAGLPQPPPT
jgi:hypothetical protein